MLGYFVLGICLLAALLVAGRWLVNIDPATLARLLRLLTAGLAGALALFFMLTGRFIWGLPLVFLALTLLRRWNMPGVRWPSPGAGRPSPGQNSEVETKYLRMTLSHDTGVMSGEVLAGPYAGKSLVDLSAEQLIALLGECHREDPESAQLLETYLDRTAGPDWRDSAQAKASGHGGGAGSAGTGMGRDEAMEILGLEDGCDDDQIREAHRRLMLKMHPDRGGSDYLAAKINQAKECLLGE